MTDRVLVVDDDQEVLEFVHTLLDLEGIEAVAAGDASAALQELRGGKVRLVLLDVAMPGIDGLQLCRQIKSDPQFGKIPVVFISARPGQHVESEALAAGAEEFLRKPFDNEELLELVRAHITN
jgi:CheY-like chemotaxis protein